jgi:hypothetical protein
MRHGMISEEGDKMEGETADYVDYLVLPVRGRIIDKVGNRVNYFEG